MLCLLSFTTHELHFAAISICKHGLSRSAHWLPVWKIQAFPARYFWEFACRETVLIGNLPSRHFSPCVGRQYWLWSYASARCLQAACVKRGHHGGVRLSIKNARGT